MEKYVDERQKIEQPSSAFTWFLQSGRDDYPTLWTDAVVLETGLFDEVDMWDFLHGRRVDVHEPNADGVTIMIVGRSDWSVEKFDMQIAVQQGELFEVYFLEMVLLALAAGAEIVEIAEKGTVDELGRDHAALEILRDGDQLWP